MKEFFTKALLCFSLLLLSSVIYAQSSDEKQVLLEKTKPENNDILKDELPNRDLDVYSILPIVMYNAVDDYMAITSSYVTFESVAYCILDEFGLMQQCGEITMPKGVEIELAVPCLVAGSYKIIFDFNGIYFQGEFEVK